MTSLITNFLKSESGMVTVDWVMMTAAGVVLALAASAVVQGGVEDLSGEMQASLSSTDPAAAGFAPLVVITQDVIVD